jgi:hypothetical protein
MGLAAYCWLARRLSARFQLLIFLFGVEALFLIRGFILVKYFTLSTSAQLTFWTGTNQVLLYGCKYLPAAMGFLVFCIVLLCEPENRKQAIVSISAQAYALTAAAVMLIPWAIGTSMQSAAASYISERLSLLSGVLLLAVVSRSTYRRWYLSVGLLIAALFFTALYCDLGKESRIEAKIEGLVHTLPVGARVVWFEGLGNRVATGHIPAPEGSIPHLVKRVSSICCGQLSETETHLLSRACLGHCFDYMNYEPSTALFRVRAAPGNSVVMAIHSELTAMRSGTYVVKASDLPLYGLIQCGPERDNLVMLPLAQGESGIALACPDAHVR